MADTSTKAGRATEAACKMLVDGGTAQQPRWNDIKKNEDMYLGVNPPALKGRSNIPFDSLVMGGFIDTLSAEVRSSISFKFGQTREQDKLSADKLTAAAERETAPDRGNWNRAIRHARFLASLSGRGFLKPHFKSMPKFRADLMVVDHYDVITEPMGGSDIDQHLYTFQRNIFRDKEELLAGARDGFYDRAQVLKLTTADMGDVYAKEIDDAYRQKLDRLTGFGINAELNSFTGTKLWGLVEGKIRFEGAWWYILFDPKMKEWIRFEPLEDVFEHAKDFPGRGPLASFATHPHPFLFWSKAPADDIRPIGYTMKKIVNLTVDQFEKRTWDMKAYDPRIFREPSKLLYKRDGLVRATLKNGQTLSDGIFQFQTPDSTGITINLVEWLNNFAGQQVGITPDSKGASNEKRVGILVSNLNQVGKRISLYNDDFKEALTSIGVMLDYGFYEYLREDYAVKLLGPGGARWDEEITRRDTERYFAITVEDGSEALERNSIELERKRTSFAEMSKDQTIQARLNPDWKAREALKIAGYDDEEIRIAMDTKNGATAEVLAKAAQAITDCLEGKDIYLIHQDATTGFVRKILDFVDDNFPIIPAEQLKKMSAGEKKRYKADQEKADKLVAYATEHIEIAKRNAVNAATSVIASRGQRELPAEGPGGAPMVPSAVPSSPLLGTVSSSPAGGAPPGSFGGM